jgi:hypothetical protein
VIRAAVTSLDKYASYLNDDDYPLDRLLAELRGQIPRTPAMERGHAFAKAMETAGQVDRVDYFSGREQAVLVGSAPLQADLLVSEGHAFAFTCNTEIEAWPRRELKAEKDYGGIIVSARCDRLRGKIIADDKTTAHFDADGCEKYTSKKQWRYYLDIFGAQEFVWHIWETREIEIKEPRDYPGVKAAWEIFSHHEIRNYRYPEMENENREFAQQYREFAEQHGL